MSTYEDHCNTLADDAIAEYFHEQFHAAINRKMSRREAVEYAKAKLVELEEHNRDMESDWRD